MNGYRVGEVAKLSGVSIRTLHHYDQLGLLKPADVGPNGYRYYGKDELLRLQQILFHRELGLGLEQIRRILDAPGFDRAAALSAHRETLVAQARRYRRLVRTIDETLAALNGDKTMDEKAMYRGFDPEAEARHQAWVIDRYGEAGRDGLDIRNAVLKDWTQADYDSHQADFAQIVQAFADALTEGQAADSEPAQAIARRFHLCTSRAWTGPINRAGFLNMAELYSEHPDMRAVFEARRAGLTEYVVEAMRQLAGKELG